MRAIAVLLLVASVSWAATRHVPSEYTTIQAAFDSLQDGDTVLVGMGIYAEALRAPQHSFLLKGDVVPDTGDYPRPTIDPTSLPGSDTLCCLTIPPGCKLAMEDMRFYNGPAMYPNPPYDRIVGGVLVFARNLEVRRCVFDSTWMGLCFGLGSQDPDSASSCWVENSQFIKVEDACIGSNAGTSGGHFALTAVDCYFQGHSMWLVNGTDSSRIARCQFGGDSSGSMCTIWGRGLVVENCLFGPVPAGYSAEDPALPVPLIL